MSLIIDQESAHFWSDLHLFHKSAIRARGFEDADAMNRDLLSKCSHLKKTDTLFLLGDISFGKFEQTKEWLSEIPSRKVLVMGNHDSGLAKHLEKLFDEVHKLLRIKAVSYTGPEWQRTKSDQVDIVCCHFPLLVWDKAHYGSWHLHGHCHGNLQWPGPHEVRAIDVGVDAFGKNGPLSFFDIKGVMDTRPIITYDHHTNELKGDWTL